MTLQVYLSCPIKSAAPLPPLPLLSFVLLLFYYSPLPHCCCPSFPLLISDPWGKGTIPALFSISQQLLYRSRVVVFCRVVKTDELVIKTSLVSLSHSLSLLLCLFTSSKARRLYYWNTEALD